MQTLLAVAGTAEDLKVLGAGCSAASEVDDAPSVVFDHIKGTQVV